MSALPALLESFNRKERFFLVAQALGNPRFTLDVAFRTNVENICGHRIPADAFVAMDYHFDWLAAALALRIDPKAPSYPNPSGTVTGTQQDVDLLIAFTKGPTDVLLLFEAKATTGWGNEQVSSKMERLRAIVGDEGSVPSGLEPYFVLISPRPPKRLNTQSWPRWCLDGAGSPRWMKLHLPDERRYVSRVDDGARFEVR